MLISSLRSTTCLLISSLLTDHVNAKPYILDHRTNISYTGITSSKGVETFRGIRYGLDTSGENRFAPPRAFVPPHGYHYNATVQGFDCPQPSGSGFLFQTNVTNISEDCLNLNIARPSWAKAGSKLPVMAYIYGGGLFTGTVNERTTAPDGLIHASVASGEPVIYVGMNYRLNIFGFPASEALRPNKCLNAGLRDQRLALEWIQQNIEMFGGDKDRVTIYGQSSGGLSVGLQILAYGGLKPVPFHAAVMESTALEPTMTSDIGFNSTAAVAVLAGCNTTDSQSMATIACLRSLSMETLLKLTVDQEADSSASNDGDIYLPVVDQDFLPQKASRLLAQGKFAKLPIAGGWMEDDATLFTSTTIDTANDTRNFLSNLYRDVNTTTFDELLDLYPVSEFQADLSANLSAEYYRCAQIFRDILLACPTVLFSQAMAKKYNTKNPPSYLYVGNQTILTSYLDATGDAGFGVIHTSELAYLFNNIDLFNVTDLDLPGYVFEPTESDYALAKSLPLSWISLGKYGDPSKINGSMAGWTSAWPARGGEGEIFVIGGGNGGMSKLGSDGGNSGIVGERLVERCGFLGREDVIEQFQF
ncbi:putative carboxylesterase type b protein [Botrytis fragariae]|uniref:Carboxylic ester hydrolase n=1 Tax=Botrytis fragariae TaxID=1964551 RepID=A0A8H6EM15_9HELO|nr:putative carboxylesterase type b protein [Botrytis fragariae]KAF5876870.1 putative carboxylesterase type b protein [Botrytis fragariae]